MRTPFILLLLTLSIATAFVTLEKDSRGIWWFNRDGTTFLSKGVDHVSYYGDYCPKLGYSPYERTCDSIYHSNHDLWAQTAARRLKSWNFNTAGAWSDDTLNPYIQYTHILDIGATAGNWKSFPDVFSSTFINTAQKIASTVCAARRNDQNLIGYFSDNELRWPAAALDYFLNLEESATGHKVAKEFLSARVNYSAVDNEREFMISVAQQYFSVIYSAIKRYDPNHLVLGCKFVDSTASFLLSIVEGSVSGGKFVDAHSIDIYNFTPDRAKMDSIYKAVQIPWIVAEFSFRGGDQGYPNSKGAGPIVPNQQARATDFATYVGDWVSAPYAIGYHWFEWVDEPRQGRFDGEDSEYGVVNLEDQVYQVLTSKMTEVNGNAENMHRSASL